MYLGVAIAFVAIAFIVVVLSSLLYLAVSIPIELVQDEIREIEWQKEKERWKVEDMLRK